MTDASPVRDLSEADWEALAMETLAELAWEPKTGAAIAPGSGERESWSELDL
jgi:type I restriction enzyme R subunit